MYVKIQKQDKGQKKKKEKKKEKRKKEKEREKERTGILKSEIYIMPIKARKKKKKKDNSAFLKMLSKPAKKTFTLVDLLGRLN